MSNETARKVRRAFESPRLLVYGSVQKITRTACPNHGIHNESSPPVVDSPQPIDCVQAGSNPGGSKKT